ncbi:MAG TPA: amylo-alpha-1,6-glucosidase, partial [Thermoanaerobaculia bacterium]|nr:amylo-alpha-1,6-glucosidase [Thermoanaerobaculia bacterium]
HNAASIDTSGFWFYNFEYERERERGLDSMEDLYGPFSLHFDLATGPASIVASTLEHACAEVPRLKEVEVRRRGAIAAASPAEDVFAVVLSNAADQFIVARGDQKSVIAGYPWFGDWGRDTMISLPGLTLVTGRYDEARNILRTFARSIDHGMLPNRFPDSGEMPEYNTVDATLWMFHAVHELLRYTGDYDFVRTELYEPLADIIAWHQRGTRYGIHVDSDGLLHAGEPGVQLTWMDAKVGDWVVTPRRGKAVELNALWYNALRLLETWVREEGTSKREETAAHLAQHAERCRESFNRRFWYAEGGHLYDVVDSVVDDQPGDDPACRPNQVLAISLEYPVLDPARWQPVMEVVTGQLLTPVGLRSLAPGDPDYKPTYDGDLRARDAAYHQGTVWAWLIGPYVDAWLRVHPGEAKQARRFLEGFVPHLGEACLGSISEVFDAEAPFTPRGCVAQAWSVAEVLRCWVKTTGPEAVNDDLMVREEEVVEG